MTLIGILEKNASALPNKTALIMKMGYRTVFLTFREVYNLSFKIACFLEKNGIQKGDKVLLLAPNSPYWIAVFWGAFLKGAILVPLNTQSTPEMVRKITAQTGAKIIFKHFYYKQDLPKSLRSYDIEFVRELVEELNCRSFKKAEVNEDDLCQIMYTSGTTGEPKGVMLSHKNLYSNLEALRSIIPISPDDRFLSILPLSHIYEQMAGFLVPFKSGSQIIYVHSPAAIRDLLKEYRVTAMAAVPEFLRIVMGKIEAKAEEEGRKKLFERLMKLSLKIGNKNIQKLLFYPVNKKFGGRLKIVASGGAPLDVELEKKWTALGIDLLQGYGLTETAPIVSCNSYRERRSGSVGKTLPGVEIKIAEDKEILVRGPNVSQGYFKNEEKTKESFTSDGWFRTGDIGEIDQAGFLYLKGRKKYMIKGPGAQNVYPEDIELELNKISGVRDSCVVGLEKSGGQVEIHAVLSFDKGGPADPEKIIKQANAKLASYQYIQGWSVWPEEDFPRSVTRKVKKEEVLKWLKTSKIPAPAGGAVGTPLAGLLAEITGRDITEINEKTKIVPQLGLDSLLRIELVARIEEKFGVVIDEFKITPDTVVSDLAEMIRKKEPVAKYPPLSKWPRFWTARSLRQVTQFLLFFPLARIFMRFRIEGRENLKDLASPAIFMPNHISYLDFLAILVGMPPRFRARVTFAAARDVLFGEYNYFAKWGELFFNAFPFPRQEYENIKTGLEHMGYLLDKNWSVVVFPEGRVSKDGKLLPLKRGAGLIAVEMGAPVVPVYIRGTEQVMPYGKFFPRRTGMVTVRFGKPINFKRADSYIEATEKLAHTMKKLQDKVLTSGRGAGE